jgi:hypothetical protein
MIYRSELDNIHEKIKDLVRGVFNVELFVTPQDVPSTIFVHVRGVEYSVLMVEMKDDTLEFTFDKTEMDSPYNIDKFNELKDFAHQRKYVVIDS